MPSQLTRLPASSALAFVQGGGSNCERNVGAVVTGPNTLGVVSTHSGYSSEFRSMPGVLFGKLNTFYFQQNTSPYISHGTDTMMTQYDTGGTENSLAPFDVRLWVNHFLIPDSPIEGTPFSVP
jgi:hypothetical protein